MAGVFTEVSNQSWFSRLGNAFKGILFGLILFAASFVLLFWNEGRAVDRHKALEEGGGKVVSVAVNQVDTGNEGKLIHLTGQATTEEELKDPVFGVGAKALKVKRTVEMYQWEETPNSETKKKLGGGTETITTYSYSKGWYESVIDSSKFKDPEAPQNPSSMPYTTDSWQAKKVDFGDFILSSALIGMINSFEPLSLGKDGELSEEMKEGVKVVNGGLYIGKAPGAPAVGDLRVAFATVNPLEISVVSVQKGKSFVPYKASNGGGVELLQSGSHSAEEMFEKAEADNSNLTWILRVVGFILMMVGLNMIFKLASVLADVIPILGSIVGAGTGIIAFLLAACLSLVTIAIAWVFYRPVLGVSLLIVAAVLIVLVVKKLRGSKAPVN
ncbi:MAG: hypothetical protein GXP30_00175 [Verrucomicrobia bacterium]|nr:hypothetical protein [Verrucomicrobiota bacterium]